jgi:hypothetical protein
MKAVKERLSPATIETASLYQKGLQDLWIEYEQKQSSMAYKRLRSKSTEVVSMYLS